MSFLFFGNTIKLIDIRCLLIRVSSIDINECLRDEDNMCDDVRGMCLNNDGGYTCYCLNGFSGDGIICTGE